MNTFLALISILGLAALITVKYWKIDESPAQPKDVDLLKALVAIDTWAFENAITVHFKKHDVDMNDLAKQAETKLKTLKDLANRLKLDSDFSYKVQSDRISETSLDLRSLINNEPSKSLRMNKIYRSNKETEETLKNTEEQKPPVEAKQTPQVTLEIGKDVAVALVAVVLERKNLDENTMGSHQYMIDPDLVMEDTHVWVVPWGSYMQLNSKDPKHSIPGITPYLVDKTTAKVYLTGSRRAPGETLKDYGKFKMGGTYQVDWNKYLVRDLKLRDIPYELQTGHFVKDKDWIRAAQQILFVYNLLSDQPVNTRKIAWNVSERTNEGTVVVFENREPSSQLGSPRGGGAVEVHLDTRSKTGRVVFSR